MRVVLASMKGRPGEDGEWVLFSIVLSWEFSGVRELYGWLHDWFWLVPESLGLLMACEQVKRGRDGSLLWVRAGGGFASGGQPALHDQRALAGDRAGCTDHFYAVLATVRERTKVADEHGVCRGVDDVAQEAA